ncbi:DNA polymerase V [Pseudomonas sp. NFACC52]|nr:DNA polymerase V [Pseudomonas sp. NFACC56-3]SFK87754.1 DNA polymerase V [Pseudomonas sp. NFACC52]
MKLHLDAMGIKKSSGAQKSLCKRVRISIRTGMFNPEEAKYANGMLVELPYPTDDVRLLTKAAMEALDRVFRTMGQGLHC